MTLISKTSLQALQTWKKPQINVIKFEATEGIAKNMEGRESGESGMSPS
jgi:hypothetical protein